MDYYLTEGLEEAEHREYKDNRSFAGAVKSQTKLAEAGNGGRYVVFSSVSEKQLAKIDKLRDARYPSLRFMYIEVYQTLIVKIASPLHEIVHREFEKLLWSKITPMGLLRNLGGMGSTRYKGISVKKEPDSCYKPRSRAGAASWPTVAVECGVSEDIGRLRVDANWWLTNPPLDPVNIVILFSVNKADRTIDIEKWERVRLLNRRSERNTPSATAMEPKCVHAFTVPAPNGNEPDPNDPDNDESDDSEPDNEVSYDEEDGNEPDSNDPDYDELDDDEQDHQVTYDAEAGNKPDSNDSDYDESDNSEPDNEVTYDEEADEEEVENEEADGKEVGDNEASNEEAHGEEPDSTKNILTLEFKKVFDRDLVEDTLEGNIEFDAFDLSIWAADIWHYGG